MKRYVFLSCALFCVSTMDAISAQKHLIPTNAAYIDDNYQDFLCTEKALLDSADPEVLDDIQTYRKPKGYLEVDYLNVKTSLMVNGNPITNNGTATASLTSYGQLSVSSEVITFENPDEWVSIPFDGTGPSSNVSVSTTSPATITIQNDGVYQINVSLYFSVENSQEDTFAATTYTFGLAVNDTTTSAAAVYASEPGGFSLNYNSIIELSANDEIQFYMQASNLEIGTDFRNIVTLQNGSAYAIQIAN